MLFIFQGYLGNCWFVAAMSSLAMRETELDKVVPKNQPMFGQKNYVGVFQFRFAKAHLINIIKFNKVVPKNQPMFGQKN